MTFTASITPTPTITITPLPVKLGKRLESYFGYSFRYPDNFAINPTEELYGRFIFYSYDPEVDGTLILDSDEYSTEMSVDQVLERKIKGLADRLVIEEPVPITIGGVDGLSVAWYPDIDSSGSGGRKAIIPQGENRFFELEIECSGHDFWGSKGSAVFIAVANSIMFSKPEVTPCEWAEDETYGLTADNPIRIGGGVAGWKRIEAYLYGMNGAGGMEPLQYQLIGSVSVDGTLLDVYLVRYETEAGAFGPYSTLFFDRSHYERPMAPDGFSCTGSHFPFSEP